MYEGADSGRCSVSCFGVGTQYHAAPVFGGLEIGNGTVRLQRHGHPADQRMVHVANQLCLGLCQRMEWAVDHHHAIVLSAWLVAKLAHSVDREV